MTFCSAVLCGNRLYCWNTMPTLRRSASLSSFGSLTSWPSTRIEPRSIGTSALMQRRSVDLPEPDGPMTQITSPFITSSETPLEHGDGAERLVHVGDAHQRLVGRPRHRRHQRTWKRRSSATVARAIG